MPLANLSACTLERLSTHDVEPALRFDTWRERAHGLVELQPLPRGAELNAELLTLRGGNCAFGAARSSAYVTRARPRRLARGPDMMVLTLMQAGEVLVDARPGECGRIAPGSLGLYDPARPASYQWSAGSREAFLVLPRQEAVAALGYEPRGLSIGLERSVLASALTGQMTLLARQALALDETERAGLLAGVRAMALLVLHQVGRYGQHGEPPWPETAASRRAAALHYMEREAHRSALGPAEIARGVGCSRTQLYEAFATLGETVMGALRELRLRRALQLLECQGRLNVEALAWRCGFADRSSFSKLFKARFGVAPSEWEGAGPHDAAP